MIPGVFAVQAMNQGPRLWTPDDLGVLPAIWLDDQSSVTDDSGAASAWENRGTLGGSFTQATANQRPTILPTGLDGKRALRFDGANDSLISTSNDVLDMMRDVGAGWGFAVYVNRKPTGDSPLFWLARGTSTASRFMFGCADGGPVVGGRRLDSDDFASANASTVTTWMMQFSVLSYQTRSADIHVDGALVAATSGMWSSGGNTANTRSQSPACIGRYSSEAQHADLDVACLIVNGGSLPSVDERERLEGWAAWRYGLQANLPIAHPYRDAPPYR